MVGIIGNGNVLAKVDDSGSIEYMFYPNIGYEKHVLDATFAIYNGGLKWAWNNDWIIKQNYVKETNILRTSYESKEYLLESRDYVPISHNMIIKQLSVTNKTEEIQNIKLFFYENIRMGEIPNENTVRFIKDRQLLVKYDGKYVFSVGSNKKISSYQCGVRSTDKSALTDMANGILKEYPKSKGLITDSALSWDLVLNPGQKQTISVFLMVEKYDGSYPKIIDTLDLTRVIIDNHEDFYELTHAYWKNILDTAVSRLSENELNRVSHYEELCKRSLLTILLLCSRNGGIMASPSLYPDYRHVWCRDGGYMAVALDLCGQHLVTEKYFEWCRKTQNQDGSWIQSYHVDGSPRLTAIQNDQIGTTLWALLVHYRKTENINSLKKNWGMVKKAANYLVNVLNNQSLSYDLWEEKYGLFTYTIGSIYGGLKSAVEISKIIEDNSSDVKNWIYSAEFLKKEMIKKIYSEEDNRFLKSVSPKDNTVDSSILGICFPFNLVDPDDPKMVNTASQIEGAFNYKIGGIGRYPEDVYFGGNPWIINTLWLHMYYEQLIRAFLKNNAIKREIVESYIQKSISLFEWTLKNNFSGLFPEQIHKDLKVPISAMPLGWSHAMFIIAVHGDLDILIP